ncbi:hypothetical protein UR09_06755 [Candidatus Nitromaritima sp. SCGC AAA799-A02]|nr:hypothetical protein UR09_06755 [Candidatus Nitromaritima sp. SCGC AAA799-A02]
MEMKKILLLTVAFVASLAFNASAANINTNETTSCTDANSITIEVASIPFENNDKFGYTSNDRGSANVAVWKSSNLTTVPIALGAAGDNNASLHGSDKGHEVGLADEKYYGNKPGRSKVVLTHQPEFSRGDSIGDISGLVKISNHGTNPVTVTCN